MIELQAEANGFSQAIIGIGVNFNAPYHAQSPITQPWTSVYEYTQQHHDRNVFCAHLLTKLFKTLANFTHKGLSPFIPLWNQYDYLRNKIVTLTSHHEKVTGVGHGIDTQGCLLVKCPNNIIRAFSSGDTTLSG